MKKIVRLFLLVFFLIPISDTIYAEDSQTTELIQQAIDKRKEFGLSTDLNFVTTLVNNHTISKVYGVYMSQEEEEKFTRRLEELDRVTEEIRSYVNANPEMKDHYLGLYIDQASGGDIYVGFRQSDSVNFNHKLASFKDNFHTELSVYTYVATYSEKEFDDISQKISDNIHQLVKEIPELKFVNPDFINQKIEIGILDKQIDEVKVLNVLSELTGVEQSLFEINVLDHTYQAIDEARTSTIRSLLAIKAVSLTMRITLMLR